jgi:malate dehydrogenase (oxaloacetate-decarboxylating)
VPPDSLSDWKLDQPDQFSFGDVVRNVHPTILIGTSAQPGAFTEGIVREMATYAAHPIIFPLSNPTSKCEACPEDIFAWTNGKAHVATGSPFGAVSCNGSTISIGQCNNSFIFPGVGLGVLASGADRVTDEMFVAAALALSELSPILKDKSASLYPRLEDVRAVSRKVALAVALEAQHSGLVTQTSRAELERRIDARIWNPS